MCATFYVCVRIKYLTAIIGQFSSQVKENENFTQKEIKYEIENKYVYISEHKKYRL